MCQQDFSALLNKSRSAVTASLFALFGLFGVVEQAAADGPKYLVVSLVGDRITKTLFNPSTGSNISQNRNETVTTKEQSIDQTAALDAADAVQKLVRGASVMPVALKTPSLYSAQDNAMDGDSVPHDLLEPLTLVARRQGADYIVLISKYRSDAQFHVPRYTLGAGKVAGLGFYVDETVRTRTYDHVDTDQGYLAPYAYLRFSLIDVQTGKPLREKVVMESDVLPVSSAGNAANAWDILTPTEKIERLSVLIRRGIDDGLSQVVGTR